MLLYNLRLAWVSFRRHPVLSALIVVGIALGIGVASTFITVRHVMARDPIPDKSDRLHYVRLDSWDADKPHPGRGRGGAGSEPPPQVTYQDATAIYESDIPARQVVMYKGTPAIYPERDDLPPFRVGARFPRADFFAMFDVPFAHGQPWDRSADAQREAVAVIDAELNEKLFGGGDNVGETIDVEGRAFRVVGILDEWKVQILYWDMTQSPFQQRARLFIPFDVAIDMELPSSGNVDGWGTGQELEGATAFQRRLVSETVWLQYWVELESPSDRERYLDFLDGYVAAQKDLGRFARPTDNRVTPLLDLMEEWEAAPDETAAMALVAMLFLALCVLNLVGLLLGKFLSQSAEIGVRRALGATRGAIFLQHLVECQLVGVLGGGLGLGLAVILLGWIRGMLPGGSTFDPQLDLALVGLTIVLALASAGLAGLYPAWRICRVAPARHLKEQ